MWNAFPRGSLREGASVPGDGVGPPIRAPPAALREMRSPIPRRRFGDESPLVRAPPLLSSGLRSREAHRKTLKPPAGNRGSVARSISATKRFCRNCNRRWPRQAWFCDACGELRGFTEPLIAPCRKCGGKAFRLRPLLTCPVCHSRLRLKERDRQRALKRPRTSRSDDR